MIDDVASVHSVAVAIGDYSAMGELWDHDPFLLWLDSYAPRYAFELIFSGDGGSQGISMACPSEELFDLKRFTVPDVRPFFSGESYRPRVCRVESKRS